MWPLTRTFPTTPEARVVMIMDKYAGFLETVCRRPPGVPAGWLWRLPEMWGSGENTKKASPKECPVGTTSKPFVSMRSASYKDVAGASRLIILEQPTLAMAFCIYKTVERIRIYAPDVERIRGVFVVLCSFVLVSVCFHRGLTA